MAGARGRSGGHNKLTAREHDLRGTLRPDRHQPRCELTDGVRQRRDNLSGMLVFHIEVYGWLRLQFDSVQRRIDAGEQLNAASLLREMRQQATTIQQLSAAIERIERDLPASEPVGDPFDEFEDAKLRAAAVDLQRNGGVPQ